MFRRLRPAPASAPATPIGSLTGDQPHDTCFRCGRPTPPGVSLCEQDNPANIKSPSATQVHGTIVIGVLAGFVLLAVLLRFATAGVGPYPASVSGVATRADGGLEVVIQVANEGTRTSGASCRVSAGGSPDYRDLVFFTEPIEPGQTRSVSHTIAPRTDGSALQLGSIAVRCN
jgi:hypothetical protein